jgi:hypothetical protein
VAPAPLSAANPPPVTRLITLGTQGGPRISSTRAQPANVLIVRGTPTSSMPATASAASSRWQKVPITRIGRIFITHNHDDHNADWGALMGIAWSLGRKEPIHVYGPRGTESMLLGFLQYFAPNVANRTFHSAGATPPASVFFAHDIHQDGPVYRDENIQVTALENCHYHYLRRSGHGWQVYALRGQTPGRSSCSAAIRANAASGSAVRARRLDPGARGREPAGDQRRIRSDRSTSYDSADGRADDAHARETRRPEDIGLLATAAGEGRSCSRTSRQGRMSCDSAYGDGVRRFYSGPVNRAGPDGISLTRPRLRAGRRRVGIECAASSAGIAIASARRPPSALPWEVGGEQHLAGPAPRASP